MIIVTVERATSPAGLVRVILLRQLGAGLEPDQRIRVMNPIEAMDRLQGLLDNEVAVPERYL